MIRISHSLVNCLLLLFVILSSLSSSAATYYATGSNIDFSLITSWKDPNGFNPFPGFTTISENFIIDGNKTINVTTNLTIRTLTLNSGSTLKINTPTDVIITIENLIINQSGGSVASGIDFGSNNVTLTVSNELNGAAFSSIKHSPSTGKTQRLILQGTSNKLYSFVTLGTGTSVVTYNGANQTVFNSNNYVNLELLGTGVKTLIGTSATGVEANVKNKLTINGCKLKLTTLNFTYSGSESNLDVIGNNNSWIYTDDTGVFTINNTTDNTRTFPIGDNTDMWAISLSNVLNKKISVRIGANTSGTPIPSPNNNLGVWYISAPTQTPTTITFMKAAGSSKLSSSSNIALYTASLWKIQPTTYISTSSSYASTTNITLSNTTTAFSLFTCPVFTVIPASLPDAGVGDDYNQSVQVDGGTLPYKLVNTSTNPSGIYTLTEQTTGVLITGKPLTSKQTTISFTSRDATGCQSLPFSYSLNAVVKSTTWNGSSWNNGEPDSNIDAVFAGNYTTTAGTQTQAKNITVNSGIVVTLGDKSVLISSNDIYNYGTIARNCNSQVTYYDKFIGNTPTLPNISLSSLNYGTVGQNFSQTITANTKASNITYSMIPVNAVPGLTMKTDGTLEGIPTSAKTYTFSIKFEGGYCEHTQSYTLPIIDLPAPNLTILNIGAKTYTDNTFNVRTYSRSDGALSYQITSGSCASIDADGQITISCAGPSPQNIITVKVTQAATLSYKSESATETFVIRPAAGRFIVLNNAFLVNQTRDIAVFTKLPAPTLRFDQLTGFSNAVVQTNGTVTPIQVGTFSVRISLAANVNYTAFDSIYTFTVTTLQKPPVAVADTIVLEMGKDSTINILENDLGMTQEIAPNKTDIDIENNGVQTKFYATELGNFLMDAEGNLTVIPFYGFIGSGRLAYTVADINGLRSEVAYVEVVVKPPYVVPELKVNQIMTPNGDNLNDALVIANTDLNKENSLIVLDQAGNIVYQTENYQNNWEGTDTRDNKVEPGIYFYTFKEKTSGREMKNYIQVVK